MKKTQILSTIALAFSLGVVAPIAVAENASAVTASTKEAAEKDIENAKKSFGTVTLNSGEKVDGYTEYAYAAGQIDAANEVVTDAKEALSSTTTSAAGILKKGVDDAIAAATGITLSQATQDKIGSTKWTAGTLAEVTEIAQAVRGEYAARFNVSAEADAAKTAVAAIDEAVKDAQEALDKAVADSNNTTLSAELKKLTGEEVDNPTTVAELTALVNKINAALPQMNRYRAVATAIANLQEGIKNNVVDDVIAKLVATLNAAVAGTGDGTTTPGDKNDGVNAPATGIAGTAEGTATTVSIVAGLATALTALGAGVVAYRSARRK